MMSSSALRLRATEQFGRALRPSFRPLFIRISRGARRFERESGLELEESAGRGVRGTAVDGKQVFDLAVIGAGPGGSACALEAARLGLSVALFDPQVGGFDKPCGEGLMPAGVVALKALGLGRLISEGTPFDKIRYRAPAAEPLEVPLRTPGLSIQRPMLQARLGDALDGAPLVHRFQSCAVAERVGDGFLLRTSNIECRARTLAVADGAWGKSAPWLKVRAKVSERLGLRARCQAKLALDCVEVHIGRGAEIYLTPLEDGEINVAVLFSEQPSGVRGARALFEFALGLYPEARARLGEFVTRPSCRRLGGPARKPAGDSTFVIGDAAGGVDPILGCGVSIALRSGMLAARGARDILNGVNPRLAERKYALAYRTETRSRRGVAAILKWTSRSRWASRFVVAVGRFFPRMTKTMVGIASSSPPIHELAA